MSKRFEKRYVITLLSVFTVFFIVIGFIFRSFYQTAHKNAVNLGNKTISESVLTVNSYLQENVDIIAMASESIEYMMATGSNNIDIRSYLVSTTRGYVDAINPDFLGIYGVFGGEYIDGNNWIPGSGYIPQEYKWYQAAVAGRGKTVIAGPYADEYSGDVIISIARCLSNGQDVIALDISLDGLAELAGNIQNNGDGHCIIFDDNGYVVASSDELEVGRNFLNGEGGDVKKELAEKIFETDGSSFEMKIYDTNSLVFADRILSDWRVAVVIDEKILFEDIIRNLIICTIVSFVLLVVIVWLCNSSNNKRIMAEKTANQFASAASIYISMHVINLKDDTFKEISSLEHIHNLVNGDYHHCREVLCHVMTELTEEQQLEEVLEFINLDTLEERMGDSKTITCEFLGKKSGWCRGRFIVVDYDENHHLYHVIWAVESIDAEKKRANHLLYLSETDLMTGIRNRGSGERKIKELIAQEQAGMFCLLDIDKFKSVNDNYGHAVGDKVIIAVAGCLKDSFRDSDVVMRLGGDEFAVFASGVVEKKAAVVILNRFFKNIEALNIPELGDRRITVSLGAVFFKADCNMSFDELYHNADKCTYDSKKLPGNVYTFFNNDNQGVS